MTPARAVGAGAHPRAAAAGPGGRLGSPPSPRTLVGSSSGRPRVGRWVGDAGCLPPLLAAPSPAGDGRRVLGLGRACCR